MFHRAWLAVIVVGVFAFTPMPWFVRADQPSTATLTPTSCVGWLGAEHARQIDRGISASADQFTEKNSAVFRYAPAQSGGAPTASTGDLTCAGFRPGRVEAKASVVRASVRLSLAGLATIQSEDVLVPSFSVDNGQTWTTLPTVLMQGAVSNRSHDGYWTLPLPMGLSLDDLERLRVRLHYADAQSFSSATVLLDGVAIDVDVAPPPPAEKKGGLKSFFSITDAPVIIIDKKSVDGLQLLDANGQVVDAPLVTEAQSDGVRVSFKPGYRIAPGTYVIRSTKHGFFRTTVIDQTFSYGIAAINTPKTVYRPGDVVPVAMGVVDDRGKTVCNAALSLHITKPDGSTQQVTTADRSIATSSSCGPKSITDSPDYSAHFVADQAGVYTLALDVPTSNGIKTVTSALSVLTGEVDVFERLAPTRINPKAEYVSVIRVTPASDFAGIFSEPLSAGVRVSQPSPNADVVTRDGHPVVSWKVLWQAGTTYEYRYIFDAPDVSPALVTLGAANYGSTSEPRTWTMSADETVRREREGVLFESLTVTEADWQTKRDSLVSTTKPTYLSTENAQIKVYKSGYDVAADKRVSKLRTGRALTVTQVTVRPKNKPDQITAVRVSEQFTQGSQELEMLHLVPTRAFRPGMYEVVTTLTDGQNSVTQTSEFAWGVLAINTPKSVYHPGEEVHFGMGFVNPEGHTICNADMGLIVTDAQGQKIALTTADGSIVRRAACADKEVTNDPDYSAQITAGEAGDYDIELTGTSDRGIRVVHDTLHIRVEIPVEIERVSATRIYPGAVYQMTLKVTPARDYKGQVEDRVPITYQVSEISNKGTTAPLDENTTAVRWQVDWKAGETHELTYRYDPEDISPALFLMGPAQVGDFQEYRQWQIASDATDNLLAFWDGGAAPTGWSCQSCGSGDFYQKFPRGAATYGGTGGSATNTHAISYVSVAGTLTSPLNAITGAVTQATKTHTHASISSTTMNTGTSLPVYQNLKVIRYDTTGTPGTIPSGAILIFDVAPSGSWSRYTAQDADFIYGENDATGTGGAATHTHSGVGYTVDASAGSTAIDFGDGLGAGSFDAHTHTVSGATTASGDHTPPYLDVLLYKATGDTTLPNIVMAMWDDTPADTAWIVNSGASQTFNGKFLRGNSSYTGTPGGSATHTHSNLGSTTSAPSGGDNFAGSGTSRGAISTHTHTATVSFGTADNLPPYLDVIIAKYSQITVSGIVRQTNESTVYDCSLDNLTIHVSVNGGANANGTCTLNTGVYSINVTPPSAAGDPVAVFIDSAETPKGTTVTLATDTTSNIASLDVYQSRLVVTYENSGPMTNAKLATADNTDAGIRYSVASTALTVETGIELHVKSSKTYTPGGTVTTQGSANMHVDDSGITTLDTATSAIDGDLLVDGGATLNVNASTTVAGGDITTAGTSAIVTTTSGTPTLTLSGTGSIGGGTTPTLTFYNLTLSGTPTLANNMTVNNNLTLPAAVTAGTTTVTMAGTAGTLVGGGSTIYNLTIDPSSTGTITLDTSNLTVSNLLTVAANDTLSLAASRILTLSLTTGTSLTMNGTISGSGKLVYSTTTTFATTGTISSVLRFDVTNGAATLGARTYGGNVEFYSTSSTGRNATLGTASGQTLNFSGNMTGIADGTGNILVRGDIYASSQTVNVTGSWSATGVGAGSEQIRIGSGTWTFSGSVAISDCVCSSGTFVLNGSGTFNFSGNTLKNLTISGTYTWSGSGHIIQDGTLTLTGATLTPGTATLTLWGTSDTIIGGGNTLPNVNVGNGSTTTTVTVATSDVTVNTTLWVKTGSVLSINTGITATLSRATSTALTLDGTVSGLGTLVYSTTANFPTSGTMSSALRFDASAGNQNVSQRTYGGAVELYTNSSSSARTITLGTAGSQTLTFSSNLTLNAANTQNLTIQGATWDPTVNVTGNFQDTGAGAGTETVTAPDAAATWTVAGNFDLSNGTWTASAETVKMTGTGNLIGSGQTVKNITIDGSGNTVTVTTSDVTVSGTLTIGGAADGDNDTLTIASGRTATVSGNSGTTLDIKGSGTDTINGPGTLTYQNSATTFPTAGTLALTLITRFDSVNGNMVIPARTDYGAIEAFGGSANARTITLGTAGSQTITTSGYLYVIANAATPNHVTLQGATWDPTLNIGGDFDFTGTGSADEIVTAPDAAATWTVSGSVDFTAGTYTKSAETLIMNGTTKTLTSAAQTLNNLTLSGSITLANATHTVAGDFSMAGGTITAGSSTVTTTGTANTITGGGNTLNNLTIDPASTGTITVQTSDLVVSATLTVASSDTLSISSSRVVTSATAGTVTINGTISGAGTLTVQNSNLSTGGTLSSIVRFDATSGDITMPNRTYGGLVEVYSNSSSNARVVTMAAGTHTLSGALNLLAANTQDVTLAAATNNPTVALTGDLDFTGAGAGTEVISSGTGTWTVSGSVDFTAGTYTATSGNTLVMNGSSKTLTSNANTLQNVTLSGTITLANATHTIAGNLSLAGGTITAGTSSVTMSGTSNTITGGGQTLTNLTIDPASTGTITLQTSDLIVSNVLSIAAGDTFSINVSRTLTLSTSSSTLVLDGTLSGSGTFVYSAVSDFPTGGVITTSLRMDATDTTQGLSARTYGGAVELYSNSSASNRSISLNSGTTTFSSSLTLNAANTKNLTLTGFSTDPTVNISGDLDYTGVGSGTEVIVTGIGTWTVSGSVDFTAGTYTATSGNTLIMNGSSKTLTSNANTLQNVTLSGTITLANATHTVAGDFSMAGGTITAGSSTVTMTGTANTITGGSNTLNNLTIDPSSAGTITLQTSNLTVNATLTVATGDTLSISAGRNLTMGTSSTVTISGTISGSGTLYLYTSNLDTNGTLTVSSTTFDCSLGNLTMPARSYSSVTIQSNDGGLGCSVTPGAGTHVLTGSFLVSAGTTDAATFAADTNNPTITIAGSVSFLTAGATTTITTGTGTWTISTSLTLTSGTFTATSGNTVVMDGTGNLVGAGESLYNLTINGNGNTVTVATSDVTVTNTFILGAAADGNNDTLSIANGRTITSDTAGTVTIHGSGTDTISGAGTLKVQNSNLSSNGTVSSKVTFDDTSGDITMPARTYGAAVIVTNTGSTGRTVTAGAGTLAFSSTLTTSKSGSGTQTLQLDTNDPTTTVTGALTIGASTTLQAPSANGLSMNGNYSNNGTFTHNSGTVTLAGAAQQTLAGTMTSGSAFNTLTVTNSSGSDPDASPSVIFSAATTASTFNAVTASTKLRFAASTTYTFTTLTLNGQATGTRVALRSSSGGTQWTVTTTTESVSNTDVKDSLATNEIIADDGTNFDSGNNNTNWIFLRTLTVTLDTTSATLGTLSTATINKAAVVSTVTTNATNGYASQVVYDHKLRIDVSNDVDDTTGGTIVAGTEEFGAATSDSGNVITLWNPTSCTTGASTSDATSLTASVQSFASTSAPATADATTLCLMASIIGATPAGAYSNTLTLVTTGKF